MVRAFISHVREDNHAVDRLAADLKASGVEVWQGRKQLKPGQRWEDEIRRMISEGDFFLACFSGNFSRKPRSYMREELDLAIKELKLRPIDKAWFIPVRLTECEIPKLAIREGETFHSIQRVDMFDDWNDGVNRILSVWPRSSQSQILFGK